MHKFIPLNMPSSEWVVSWVIGIRKQNVHCSRRSGAALNCRRKLEKVQQAFAMRCSPVTLKIHRTYPWLENQGRRLIFYFGKINLNPFCTFIF